MKQLNIGIIGAGRIGKLHAQSITYAVPAARVTASRTSAQMGYRSSKRSSALKKFMHP